MAKEYKSPIAGIATVSASDFEAFDAFMNERAASLDAEMAAYANKGTVPGPIRKPTRILTEAAYIPASSQVVTPERAGKLPTYIVVARSEGTTPLLQQIRSATSSNAPAPHFLVGYGGEIVQLADLEAKTNFLEGKTYRPPGALSRESLEERLIDSVISLTVSNEAGKQGYAAFTDNDAGTGVAFGFIQFNQTRGTLAKLLRKMYEYDQVTFRSTFGIYADQLLRETWVSSLSTNLVPLKAMFKASAEILTFQRAQRDLARQEYWTGAVAVVSALGITTQRAYAIAFDGCVQRGPGFMVKQAVPAANREATPSAKLKVLAEWADTKSDSGALMAKTYYRRRELLQDPDLSDVEFFKSQPVQDTTEPVSDATVVAVVLEGAPGASVSVKQRDAAAKVIRAVCDAYAIRYGSSRVFGLDRLKPAAKNPGSSFSYLDLLSAVASLQVPQSPFREAEPVTATALAKAKASLMLTLQSTRGNNIKALALLQCYDDVRAEGRAQSVASRANRQTHYAAAAKQAKARQLTASANSAAAQQVATATQDVPQLPEAGIRGLLFDFDKGVWNDSKAVGKIS